MSTDDDIIRKRLLIEGDGGGDDRRLNKLLKTFSKWCTSDASQPEFTETYQRMLITVAQSQFAVCKSELVYDMNKKEIKKYEQIYKEIEDNIQQAHQQIQDCKEELAKAKRIRKNKEAYDALAKVIRKHPDRQETQRKLEELDKEVNTLKENKSALETKLEIRQKQFLCLVRSIHDLQAAIEEENQHGELTETDSHDVRGT